MKKKIISICLVGCFAVMAIAGATMAYFTDTDEDKNVMVMGNVEIEQLEKQYDENGELEDFEDGKMLLPGVYEGYKVTDDLYNPVDLNNITNAVDKIISVKNNSSTSVYARTVVAFEHTDPAGDGKGIGGIAWKLHNIYGAGVTFETFADKVIDCVKIGDQYYSIAVYTYEDSIAAGETSVPSLLKVFLDSSTTQKDIEGVGDTYEILAVSQAVQAEGFDSADEALDAAFGDVGTLDAAVVAGWFADIAA